MKNATSAKSLSGDRTISFQETMQAYIEKTWEQWLGPLVPELPSFETVIGELRPQIENLFR